MTRKIRPIRIEGNLAFVSLTKGHEAVIDAEDVPLINDRNWHAKVKPWTVYAASNARGPDGQRVTERMHRVILAAPESMEVDHADGNGLNNCKQNLRVASGLENKRNRRIPKDNTSGLKGVVWRSKVKRWQAQIGDNGKKHHLGYFATKEEAHAAYADASQRLHGSFGRVA